MLFIYLLAESQLIISRISPSSSLPVTHSTKCSSSRTTLSIWILKNGAEWHPGCLDHVSSTFLAKASPRKYAQECDMLHLQSSKSKQLQIS